MANSIRDKPWNAVAQAASGVIPSPSRRRQTGEQIGARKILAEHVHRVAACSADNSIETDDTYVSLLADVHRIIDSRQIRRIERGRDDAVKPSIRAQDPARKFDRPFSGRRLRQDRPSNKKLVGRSFGRASKVPAILHILPRRLASLLSNTIPLRSTILTRNIASDRDRLALSEPNRSKFSGLWA